MITMLQRIGSAWSSDFEDRAEWAKGLVAKLTTDSSDGSACKRRRLSETGGQCWVAGQAGFIVCFFGIMFDGLLPPWSLQFFDFFAFCGSWWSWRCVVRTDARNLHYNMYNLFPSCGHWSLVVIWAGLHATPCIHELYQDFTISLGKLQCPRWSESSDPPLFATASLGNEGATVAITLSTCTAQGLEWAQPEFPKPNLAFTKALLVLWSDRPTFSKHGKTKSRLWFHPASLLWTGTTLNSDRDQKNAHYWYQLA